MAPRKPKAKAGGLTRDQQTRALRKRDGFSTKQLIPGGLPITYDEATGMMNLSELLHAEAQQRGGKSKRLANWTRLPASKAALEAIESATQIRAAELLRIGQGRADSWGHPQVAVEVARWLSPPLGALINGWWLEMVNSKKRRPRPLDAASAKVVADRRAANASLSAVAHERSVPPFMVHDAKVQGLTGKQPRHWAAELGTERWQETAPIGHQALQMMASQAAANSCQALDPDESTKRHYIAAAKEAGSDLRSYAEKYGLPYQPTYDGPAFSGDRVKRVLEQANDVPLLNGEAG
jgi:hypothetical protein